MSFATCYVLAKVGSLTVAERFMLAANIETEPCDRCGRRLVATSCCMSCDAEHEGHLPGACPSCNHDSLITVWGDEQLARLRDGLRYLPGSTDVEHDGPHCDACRLHVVMLRGYGRAADDFTAWSPTPEWESSLADFLAANAEAIENGDDMIASDVRTLRCLTVGTGIEICWGQCPVRIMRVS
jgi:hypothetical protein